MISEGDEIKRISKSIGLKKTCDLIAEAACDKFLNETGREFMLTDDCVSKEILDHIEAYYWSIGEKNVPNYLAAGFIAMQSLDKLQDGDVKSAVQYNAQSVYEATKSIDMRKSDIVKVSGVAYYSSQAFLFNYKQGLREEYIGTQYDPWADERK